MPRKGAATVTRKLRWAKRPTPYEFLSLLPSTNSALCVYVEADTGKSAQPKLTSAAHSSGDHPAEKIYSCHMTQFCRVFRRAWCARRRRLALDPDEGS